MKVKSSTLRFAFLLFASLLATCATMLFPSTAFLPAQEVGIATINNSDYRYVTAWGKPAWFVHDMLNSQSIGQIDSQDYFSAFAFLANWLIWFAVALPLSYVVPIFAASSFDLSGKSRIQRKKINTFSSYKAAPRLPYFKA